MKLTRRFALLGLLALAACVTPPPAERGVLFPANFGDSNPATFNVPRPAQFAVHGIDAARFQKSINWNTARANGVNFAFIKATEGGDLLDPAFKKHWRGAGQARVERGAHYGQRPIIYTTPKFYRENGLGQLKGYDFWLRSTAKTLDEVYPGQAWKFWQYTATGRVQGIAGDVDLNAFSGSPEAWKAWLAARSVR